MVENSQSAKKESGPNNTVLEEQEEVNEDGDDGQLLTYVEIFSQAIGNPTDGKKSVGAPPVEQTAPELEPPKPQSIQTKAIKSVGKTAPMPFGQPSSQAAPKKAGAKPANQKQKPAVTT